MSRYFNDPMTQWLNSIAWLTCIIYSTIPSFWLLIHPRVEFWRSREQPYRMILPLWVGLWIIFGAVTWPWRNLRLYHLPWTWLPALIFFIAGFYLYRRARHNFTPAQLGGLPEIRADHHDQRLVTEGIRARVRHPVYLGHLCEMLAWSLGSGLLVSYVLTGFAIVTGAIMIRTEDRELEQRFGAEYVRYRSRVPAVLPAWRKL